MGKPVRNRRGVTKLGEKLGKRLRSIRQRKGWSLEILSERAGMHVTYLSSVERGYRNPTLNVIGALAGMAIGAGLCWLQDNVGLVGMGMENSVVPDYPVKLILTDFVFVGVVIFLVTATIAWAPARAAAKSAEVRIL